MAQRLGWFVGLSALVLVLLRLAQVLEPAVDTPDWRVLVPAAAVGGVLVTWATARLGRAKQVAAHLLGLTVVLLRVTATDTLLAGLVPGPETWPALNGELAYALDILRFGSPPVLAVGGLTALAAAALWILGAGWGWGVVKAKAWVGIVPPLGFYLYLAVVDRSLSTTAWNLAFGVVAALGLVATANLVPAGAGHLRSSDQQAQPRWQAGPGTRLAFGAVAMALVGTSFLSGAVPAGGALNWRAPGGEGTSTGEGFTASRFVDLRQSLVSLSETEVFAAVVEPSPPPGPAAYWRLLTLDEYTGEEWVAGDHDFGEVTAGAVTQPPGDTETITQTIQIASLRDDRLPSLYLPEELESNDSIIRSGASLGSDGNLRVNGLTFEEMTYRVRSDVPRLDLGLLASRNGELTPMFARAVDSGDISVTPRDDPSAPRPPEIEDYLNLPGDMDPAIAELASDATVGASNSFETALLLEDFLREFDYSTSVSTGHSALDLAAWLSDPESPNYRTGYCEQFAATMAVMGRMLGLPTRVVIGFTPGEVVDTDDGPLHVVRENNAHAWVEVWLDGQGWVAFDPTPRSDGTTTPISGTLGFDPSSLALTSSVSSGDQTPVDQFELESPPDVSLDAGDLTAAGGSIPLLIMLAIAGAMSLGAAALPTLKSARRRRRLRRAAGGDMEAVWAELTDRLADLGAGPAASQTPLEFAQATSTELVPLARAYSDSIYGERHARDAVDHLERAELWIGASFHRGERTRAAFSTRSFR